MNKQRLARLSALCFAVSIMVSCGSGNSDSDPSQPAQTETSLTQSPTSDDAELAGVESELASLDADLEVIDQALADNATATPPVIGPGSALGVDEAANWQLADNAATSDGSFATAEANRMNTLQDLSTTASYIPECNIAGPC